MILKIGRKRAVKLENNKVKVIEVYTEYFQSDEFTIKDDVVINKNRDAIFIGPSIDNENDENIETIYVYLMNDEGKTVERLK